MGSMYACKCTCARTYQIEYGAVYNKWRREREGQGNFKRGKKGELSNGKLLRS